MASKGATTSIALLLFSTLLISFIPSSSAGGTSLPDVNALVSACVYLGSFKATSQCCSLFSPLDADDVGTCLCNILSLGILINIGIDDCLSELKLCANVKVPVSVTCL